MRSDSRNPPGPILLVVLAILAMIGSFLMIGSASGVVLGPILALLTILGVFSIAAQRRHGGAAPLDIGTLYVVVVTLYGIYPLTVYSLLGGNYTILNDARLLSIQPSPDLIARIGWYYVIYLSSFVLSYALACGSVGISARVRIKRIDASVWWAVLGLFVILRVGLLAAELAFAAPAEDYLSKYLQFSHLPLVARQVLGHANGIASIFALALIVMACQRWAVWRWPLFAWFVIEFAVLMVGLGARTQFVVLCLGLMVSYHYIFRPISMRLAVSIGGLLLGAFLVFGVLRAYQLSGFVGVGLDLVAGASEFESLFANAVDVDRLVSSGDIDRGQLAYLAYFGDFFALVPQQLVPFEKSSLSIWYVSTYYADFADAGGGLAFGSIAESLIGTGVPDLVWRGIALGVAFGSLDRMVRRQPVSMWWFVFYVWVASSCYLAFRVSTLALLPVFLYRFVPAVAAAAVLASIIRRAASSNSQVNTLSSGVGQDARAGTS